MPRAPVTIFVVTGLRPGRQLVEHRDVEVAVGGQRERARDRGRGHHEQVRRALAVALVAQLARAARRRTGAARRSRPGRARANPTLSAISAWVPIRTSSSPAASSARIDARIALGVDAVSSSRRRPEAAPSARQVSACCSASSSVGAITAVWRRAARDLQRGGERHAGLAGADIALQQAVHRRRPREVAAELVDRAPLRRGERERQRLRRARRRARARAGTAPPRPRSARAGAA